MSFANFWKMSFPENFRDDFFEKNVLHMPASFDRGVYTWEDFGRDFYSLEPGIANVRLYREGLIDKSGYIFGVDR